MRIVEDAIEPYAAALPADVAARRPTSPGASDEQRAAFQLTLNAINFGSGWFPTLRKRAGAVGFRTVEAGLRAHGPWTADAARRGSTREEVAAALGQDPEHELMGLFATALRELGRAWTSTAARSSRFARAARLGRGARRPSSPAGPRGATSRPTTARRCRSSSARRSPPPTSRWPASPPTHDLARLTLFADNLVPHVLRLDGVLAFDADAGRAASTPRS